MKSTPRSRDHLLSHLDLVPPPRGCVGCLKHVPGQRTMYDQAISCQHAAHFQAITDHFRERGLRELGDGSFRRCFVSKNDRWVYKVPLVHVGYIGYIDNYFESVTWRDRDSFRSGTTPIGHRIARCRLHPSGVLVMEKVERAARHFDGCIKLDETLRKDEAWAAIANIDSCQGGIAHDGKFKIYDYTHWVHIVEPIPASMMAL